MQSTLTGDKDKVKHILAILASNNLTLVADKHQLLTCFPKSIVYHFFCRICTDSSTITVDEIIE